MGWLMFVKVVEIGSVLWSLPRMGSILGTGRGIPGFVKVCWYQIHSGHGWMPRTFLWSDINWNCLARSRHWGRATKRQIFFCVWRGRWIFCEFPPTWNGVWDFIEGDILEQGLGDNWVYVQISTILYVPKNLWTRFFNCSWGRNRVDQIDW